MNLYKIQLLLLLLLSPLSSLHAQVTYEFCMTAKYGKTIVLDFKVHNNSAAPIADYNFIFDWRGVSNAVMWSGLDVIQNGDKGVVELRKTTWGAALPVGTTVFSVTIDYEMGMFPPDTGTLNGAVINGITCYTPPAHENFECERNFSAVCTVKPAGPTGQEIKIGEGNVYAWKSPLQVYIPDNRKSWAISMAVSHSLLTNLVGFDLMSINEYFATAIQESNAGCEGSKLIAPGWVTKSYPSHDTNNPVFCYDKSGAVAVGYFQQEMGGSWVELDTNYPCFIPQVTKDTFTGDPATGSSFEFQSIVKAYHDYRNIAYWQYVKCWNPIEFFKSAHDPYAAVKIIGMAYNQGMNHNSFEDVFSTDRAAAIGAANLMDRISPGTPTATNRLYAEQINRLTKVLDDKVSEINWADAAVFGVTDQSAHSFRGFYDASFTWDEVEEYIKKIVPFYTSFGVDETAFIAAIKPVFDSINGGNAISFRYQISAVVEAIVVYLPAFDPKKGLAEVYGGSGANSCFAPTARMEGYEATCGEDLSLKLFFSGKAPYTFTYKRTDVTPEIVFPEITTSQNPYTIKPVEEGTYALTAIRDNVSAGEVVCEPVSVKYGIVAAAKLSAYGNPCDGILPGIQVEITSNVAGPYLLEYENEGVLYTVSINSSPYILVTAPAPMGSYHLTKISAGGCDVALDETILIDWFVPPVFDLKLLPYGEDLCLGTGAGIEVEFTSNFAGPYLLEYEINGILQPAVTLNSSPYTLVTVPAPVGSYHVTKVSAGGCDVALDETITIDKIISPVFDAKLLKYGEDVCLGTGSGIMIEFTSNVAGPYIVEYELDGILQPAVTLNSSPYTLVTAPAPLGTYHVTKVSAGGCAIVLDETITIAKIISPVFDAKLLKYGEDVCLGTGSGIMVEFTSNVAGPYIMEYELDGILQPAVTLSSSPYNLVTAPAPVGNYHLTKVSAGGCDVALSETITIDKIIPPVFDAKLLKYGEDVCLGSGSGIVIEFTSNVAGPYIMEYELDGILQPAVTLNSSPYTLVTAPAPVGSYHVTKVSAGGCDVALDETITIAKIISPVFDAKLLKYGEDVCLGTGSGIMVEFTTNVAGPYIMEYELDGILQPAVTLNSSPYTLVMAPAQEGSYHVTKVSAAGCEIVLDETITIDKVVTPVFNAKLLPYGEDLCMGIGSGIEVEFTSNVEGPYVLEYEKDGVLQPAELVHSSPFIMIVAPALQGTYRLINVFSGGCDIPLDETVLINHQPTIPVVTAQLVKYGEDLCLGTGPGLQVEFTSNVAAPFLIEYEIDGISQPAVVIDSSPYTLITAAAPLGIYHLTKISAGGCDFALDETVSIDKNTVPPLSDIKWVLYGEDPFSGIGPGLQIEFTSTVAGPYIIEYEKDGVLQPAVTMNSSPYTLIAAPAPAGTYRLKKITLGGCEFQLNETAIIETSGSPSIRAQLVSYGEIPCVVGPGVRIQIASNISGPYVIEYEIDGVQQSPVITSNNFPIIRTAPAIAGTYRLTKISKEDTVFYFNNTLLINNVTVPPKVNIEGDLVICEGFATILTAITNPSNATVDSYQWVKDNTEILGANEKTLGVTTDGEYLVRITVDSGCIAVSPIVPVVVRKKEECEEASPEPIPDPEYPKFFTPNGDGINDSWHFKNFDNWNKAEIDIFDRYGKFITRLTQSSPGWDGTYNNQALYATDYWFVLTYEEQHNPGVKRNLRGHFSLKR